MASSTNNLALSNPELAFQWHPDLNDRSPEQVTRSSGYAAWWRCPENAGHVWKARVNTRVSNGAGCPYCARQLVCETNSLAALHPEIAEQWHAIRNGDLTPEQVTAGTDRRVWWQCPVNPDHEYHMAVVHKTSRGLGCPMCSGRQLSVTNSLTRLFPAVASEWADDLNDEPDPARILAGSNLKRWWRCRHDSGHVWRATVNDRTYGGRGCPHCCLLPESDVEIRLRHELAQLLPVDPTPLMLRVDGRRYRADVSISSHRIVVEYDGSYWHEKTQTRDEQKNSAFAELGWQIIRVREQPLRQIGNLDLRVVANLKVKKLACLVARHLADIVGVYVPRLLEYEEDPRLWGQEAAETYIEQRLAGQDRG